MTKQFHLAQQTILAFVPTRDPDRAKKFYRDTLGLPLVSEELPFALVFDVKDSAGRGCGWTYLRRTSGRDMSMSSAATADLEDWSMKEAFYFYMKTLYKRVFRKFLQLVEIKMARPIQVG
jgi:hypothetical protein